MRVALASFSGASLACGLLLWACGGAESSAIVGGDSGSDSTATEGGAAGSSSSGGSSGAGSSSSGSSGSGGSTSSGGSGSSGSSSGGVEAGPPACAPPTDPSKAALCVTLAPETIAFTGDARFDGKGWLIAQVFDSQFPDYPDGGSKPALATTVLPAGAPDAGVLDLSQGIPVLRFDDLPDKVYARAIFVDDPAPPAGTIAAGTWLAGYDLTGGIQNQLPLAPQTLTPGSGTAVTLPLVALRELIVTMDRGVTPAGNGEGPATFAATPDQVPSSSSHILGIGQSACARVDGTNQAQVSGFVIGKGPYYVAGDLDDFGSGDGGNLPPGSLVDLEANGAGGYRIPAADQLTYPANAYRVSQTITLGLVIPGAPATDTVSCP